MHKKEMNILGYIETKSTHMFKICVFDLNRNREKERKEHIFSKKCNVEHISSDFTNC